MCRMHNLPNGDIWSLKEQLSAIGLCTLLAIVGSLILFMMKN